MFKKEGIGFWSNLVAEIRQVRKPLYEVALEVGGRLGGMFEVPQKLGLSSEMERILYCEIAVGLLKKDKYLAERRGNEVDVAIEVLTWEIEKRRNGLWGMYFKEREVVKMSLGLIGRAANMISAIYTDRVDNSLDGNLSEMGEEVKEAMGIALSNFVRSDEKYIKKLSSW